MLSTAAAAMAVIMMPGMMGLHVFAEESASGTEETDTQEVSVYRIDRNDPSPLASLKQEVLEQYAEKNDDLEAEEIDMDASSIETSSIDWTKEGLQPVTVQVNVVTENEDGTKNSAYTVSDTETAEINIVSSSAPQITLKSESVTVDLGSTFNYADNIGYVSSASNALPVLSETDNVDVNTEGNYTVNVEAVSAQGTTDVSYQVVVKKPAEVVRAEEEAAAQAAAEEAAQKAAEEEAARKAAEEAEAAAQAAAASEAAQQAQTAAASASVSTGYTGGIDASTGSAIADYALSLVGCPYVYGGTSPAGFDCSGFTQYVYAHFGISLPHSSGGQAACGTVVSVADAQPGDLVTYSGHAAIYIGNGMIVNALNPSSGVCVCSMYLSNGGMTIHRLG